jgi:superfamily II DNA or RNA helicase
MASWHLARQVLSLPQNKLAVIDALLERHHQRRVLIFTRDNCAAYALSRHLLVPALTCHIRRAERTAVLDAFARGQIRVLVSSRVLNEGLDVPDAEVAIIAGGAQGDREYIQRVGRVLRNRPQKTALIYELVVAETFESRSARRHFRHLAAPQKTTSQSPAKSGSFVDKPPASRRPVRPRFK